MMIVVIQIRCMIVWMDILVRVAVFHDMHDFSSKNGVPPSQLKCCDAQRLAFAEPYPSC